MNLARVQRPHPSSVGRPPLPACTADEVGVKKDGKSRLASETIVRPPFKNVYAGLLLQRIQVPKYHKEAFDTC
eukprot:3461768-Amphidinium_carterae.1